LCDWIRDRLAHAEAVTAGEDLASEPPAPQPQPAATLHGRAQPRDQYRIRRAELVADDGQRTDLIEEGRSVIVDWVRSPSRIAVWIEPAPSQLAMVAARVVDIASGARVMAGPTELSAGQEKIELAVRGVLPGVHDVTVVVWDVEALSVPGQAMATFTVPAAAGAG
jgi:hypothetical protein